MPFRFSCYKDRRRVRRAPGGFALTELVISVALTAVCAIAVTLAVVGSSRRAGEAKSSLSLTRREADVLRRCTEELRWAKTISALAPDSITFTCPDAAGTGSSGPIRYHWEMLDRRLYRTAGAADQVVAEGVQDFSVAIGEAALDSGGNRYLRSVVVTVRFSTDSAELRSTVVPLVNFPLW